MPYAHITALENSWNVGVKSRRVLTLIEALLNYEA